MRSALRSLAVVAVLAASCAFAQTNYVVSSVSQTYVPLSGTGVTDITSLLANPNGGGFLSTKDEGYYNLQLGFTFPYFGSTYTSVGINTNGILLFGPTANGECDYSTGSVLCTFGGVIPDTSRTPHNVIAPWWADHEGNANGTIKYFNPSPSEVVIEFSDWNNYSNSTSSSFNFQVRLNASGLIQIHYGSKAGTFQGTAGFEDSTGTQGAPLLPCAGPSGFGNCSETDFPANTLFTIGQPVQPDLMVQTVTLNSTVKTNNDLTISVTPTFRNLGQNDANNFHWKAYLSSDKILDPSDALFYDSSVSGSTVTVLGANNTSNPTATATGSGTVTNVANGNYYVLVQADTTNVVTEFSETNNVGATATYFTFGVDLVANAITGPTQTGPGNTETLQLDWFNQGTDAAPNTQFEIVLSSDQILDSGDFVVDSWTANVNGTQTCNGSSCTRTVSIPQNVPGGDYYFGLHIVPSVPQTTTNDVAFATTQTKVFQADLEAESADFIDAVNLQPTRVGYIGGNGTVTTTFKNIGGADAKNYKIAVVLSRDANLSLLNDLILVEQPVTLTPAGSTQTVTIPFSIPLVDAKGNPYATGNYYFFVILDSASNLTELSKFNNTRGVGNGHVEPILLHTPSSDYAVTSIDVPAAAAVGEVLPIFRVIQNVGNDDGQKVSYRYFASANEIVTTEDVPLQLVGANGQVEETRDVTLAKGQSDSATDYARIPPTLLAGTWYIGCVVDVGNTEAELDETNNALASTASVQVAPSAMTINTQQLPDATVGMPYAFKLSISGAHTPVQWTVQGDLPLGLELDPSTGVIDGTPSATSISSFSVYAQNADQAAAARLVMRVVPASGELAVITTRLPPVIDIPSAAYAGNLAAAGGTQPYAWAVISGALPNGISMDVDGNFSGAAKPGLAVGEYPALFEVTDSLGNRARAQLKVRVVEPGALLIKTLVVPEVSVGSDYIADFSAVNADGSTLATPLDWTIIAGRLPEGLAFTVAQSELGLLTGKPHEAGSFPFTVQVVDAKGRVDVADFVLRVHPTRLKLSAVDAPAVLHPGDDVNFQITTGNTESRYRLFSGALPPGLTLNENGAVTGTVEMENSVGTWNYVAQANGPTTGESLGAFTLEVKAVPAKAGCSASGGSPVGMFALLAPLGALAFRRRRAAGVVAALAAVAVMALPTSAHAQTNPYTLVGPQQNVYQALSGGSSLTLDSYTGTTVSIPFDFEFYGAKYSSVGVSLDGYLSFTGSLGETYNYGIPYNASYTWLPSTVIAPWWAALTKSGTGAVKYATLGAAPNRDFVIEWKDISCLYCTVTTTKFSFQVHLYEGSNKIRFAYGTQTPPSGLAAAVGIVGSPGVGLAGLSCTTTSSGNCSSSSFPLAQTLDFALPPDLQVKGVSTDDTGYAGVTFPASATLQNLGGLDANGAYARFYLSTDAVFDKATDLQLGDSNTVTVPVSGTTLVTATLQFASTVAPGNYFLFAEVDPDGLVAEGQKESNNVSAPIAFKVGPPTPDFQVLGITGPSTANSGATLTLNPTIRNGGNADSTVPTTVTYFVSDNSVVTVSDIEVGKATLPAMQFNGAQYTTPAQVTLPANLPAGKYWVGLCVDYDSATAPNGNVQEISEVNNCATGTSFVLNTGALAVVTTSIPSATQNAPFGLRLEASGGNGTYTWSLDSGALPPGVTLSSAGDLVGTPSEAGDFSFTVKVASGASETSTKALTWHVEAKNVTFTIADQTLPSAEFGRGYSVQLVAVGGHAPYTWALKDGSHLPTGLGLSTDGIIEGRPAKAATEPFAFSVVAKDQDGTEAAKDLQILVTLPSSMHIATSKLNTAYISKSYKADLQAIGGQAPYLWSVVKFQKLAQNATETPGDEQTKIPDGFGLTVVKTGDNAQLSGTPQLAGLYAITFRVQDNAGAEDITTLPLLISYDKGLAITTTVLPDAFVNTAYATKISHNGGDGVSVTFSSACVEQANSTANGFSYSCVAPDASQQLPAGLVLGPDGSISGTPTALPATAVSAGNDAHGDPLPKAAIFSFLVKVQDDHGRADVRSLSIKVREAPVAKSGCSGTGMGPAAIALLALVGLGLRRRRQA